MKRQTVTLLPFAPHQQPNSPPWSPHRESNSRLPGLLNSSVPCIMSGTTPKRHLVFSRRPNPLRIRPSIISEASCDTTASSSSSSSSASSSSSSSSSSFPNTSSPTSFSTSPTSLPPSPPPPYVLITPSLPTRQSDCSACGCDALIAIAPHARFFLISPSNHLPGKSRPLPRPPAPTERPVVPYDAAHDGEPRPRSPPPAWSPPETSPTNVRPTLPGLILPVAPPRPQRDSSGSPEVRVTPNSPRAHLTAPDGSVSSPGQLRVRPLPMRPVPPGPPSEDNTPIAPYRIPRWHADPMTIPQDEISSSPYDDRAAIDWDLIDEVMKNAG